MAYYDKINLKEKPWAEMNGKMLLEIFLKAIYLRKKFNLTKTKKELEKKTDYFWKNCNVFVY